MRGRGRYPEIFCDFNAQLTETGYSLERPGSIADLEALGLTLEEAIGKRFTFVTDDSNEAGEPDTMMLDGLVVRDPEWGYLAVDDGGGFYWRSHCDTP